MITRNSIAAIFFLTVLQLNAQIRPFEKTTLLTTSEINFFDSRNLIELFLNDLELSLDNYLEQRVIPEKIQSQLKANILRIKNNSEISVDFDLMKEGVLGESYSIYDDTKITLSINPVLWNDSSDVKKLYVLYHELGHDVLNFKHGEGGKMMFTISEMEYSQYFFDSDRIIMFEMFFEKMLEEFNYREEFYLLDYEDSNSLYTWTVKTDETRYVLSHNGKLFNGNILMRISYRDEKYPPKLLDGKIYSGIYSNIKNGVFSGEAKGFVEGNLVFKRNYNNGILNGETLFFNQNGSISSVTNFKNGIEDGERIEYWENGEVFQKGLMVNGLKEGLWKEFDEQGILWGASEYKDGTEYLQKLYYPNGQIKSELNVIDGQLNGEGIVYRENGLKYIIGYYKNGIRSGEWKFLNVVGGLETKAHFVDGQIEGEVINYYPNGDIESIVNVTNNVKNGIFKSFYNNEKNTRKLLGRYSFDLKVGEWREYNFEGFIQSSSTYKAGVLNGSYIAFHENGELKETGNYLNGRKVGKWIEYNSNGKKLKTIKY